MQKIFTHIRHLRWVWVRSMYEVSF